MKTIINQTIWPHYRVDLIREISRRAPRQFSFVSGEKSFGPSLVTDPRVSSDVVRWRNWFSKRESVIWQLGAFRHLAFTRDLVITEFNLRCLSTIAICVIRSFLRRKTVLWGHVSGRSDQLLPSLIRRLMLSLCDGFITYTESDGRRMRAEKPLLAIWTAPNSLYTEAQILQAKNKHKEEGTSVVYVGRLTTEKRVDSLVREFHEGRKLGFWSKEVVLKIAGDGPLFGWLRTYIEKNDLATSVILLGQITEFEKLLELYGDAICSVSAGYIGLQATQSLAFGVPVVLPKGERHSPEVVLCEQGSTAVFYSEQPGDHLRDSLAKVISDAGLWRSRRAAIIEKVLSQYTIEKMACAFLDVSDFFRRQAERRVAVIFWSYLQAYHVSRIRSLSKAVRREDWSLVPIALAEQGAEHHKAVTGLSVPAYIRYLSRKAPRQILKSPSLALRHYKCLTKIRPGVVFTPGYVGLAVWASILYCRLNNAKLVVMFETQARDLPRKWYLEFLKKWILKNYASCFAGGISHGNYAVELGIPPPRVVFGYDAVDNDYIGRLAQNERLQLVNVDRGIKKMRFIAVGRFVQKKNFVGLIKAYNKYVERVGRENAFGLTLVGDGPEYNNVVQEIQSGNTKELVNLPGYLDSEAIFRALAQADVFVMPSRKEEQWGLVVNEAMAAGLPVLVSSICGCADELVLDGKTGWIFDATSEVSLELALLRCHNEARQLAILGLAARQHIQAFGLENFAQGAIRALRIAVTKV